MKAMVLAAGVGSRLDPLTARVPKPLVPIANVPVMEHIVGLLSRHGYTDIVANLHYLPDMLREHFGDGSKFGVNLTFRYEEELTGDAGGVRACRDFFDDTFIVLMGDLLTDADLTSIVAAHKRKGALATIGVKQVEEVEHFGVVVRDENGFITGFQEKPKRSEALSNMVSAGIYVLEPEVFDHMPVSGVYGFGRQLFPLLVEGGQRVLGEEIKSYWSDVGTIEQYRQSNFDVLKGLTDIPIPGTKSQDANKTLWLCDGASVSPKAKVTGNLLIGKNSKVDEATFAGCVIVGDNCQIHEGAYLENAIVWSGSVIESGAVIKNSIIGEGGIVKQDSKHVEVTTMAQPSSPLMACAR